MDASPKGNRGRAGHPEVHESVDTAPSSTSVIGGLGEVVVLSVTPWRGCLVFRGLTKYIFAKTQPLPYLRGQWSVGVPPCTFQETVATVV